MHIYFDKIERNQISFLISLDLKIFFLVTVNFATYIKGLMQIYKYMNKEMLSQSLRLSALIPFNTAIQLASVAFVSINLICALNTGKQLTG